MVILPIQAGMELRLLHTVAHRQTWYGRWGFLFGRGGFAIGKQASVAGPWLAVASFARRCSSGQSYIAT